MMATCRRMNGFCRRVRTAPHWPSHRRMVEQDHLLLGEVSQPKARSARQRMVVADQHMRVGRAQAFDGQIRVVDRAEGDGGVDAAGTHLLDEIVVICLQQPEIDTRLHLANSAQSAGTSSGPRVMKKPTRSWFSAASGWWSCGAIGMARR